MIPKSLVELSKRTREIERCGVKMDDCVIRVRVRPQERQDRVMAILGTTVPVLGVSNREVSEFEISSEDVTGDGGLIVVRINITNRFADNTVNYALFALRIRSFSSGICVDLENTWKPPLESGRKIEVSPCGITAISENGKRYSSFLHGLPGADLTHFHVNDSSLLLEYLLGRPYVTEADLMAKACGIVEHRTFQEIDGYLI